MGLVTVFWPLTTTGLGETTIQTPAEPRFVLDCKVNPLAAADQVKITLAPDGVIANTGGGGGKAREKIVPLPDAPPTLVVP